MTNGTLTVTGSVSPSGGVLTIADGATVNFTSMSFAVGADGSCGCLATPGSLDLSDVSISVANMAACPPRGLTIVDAGSVTGTPSISLDVPCTSVVSGGRVRVGVPGGTLILR